MSSPSTNQYNTQWGETIISSYPKSTPALARLQQAVKALPSFFRKTRNPLLPRSILTLFAHVASALFLLEHAVWARANSEPSAPTDIAVFERWVDGLTGILDEIKDLDHDNEKGVQERMRVNTLVVGAVEEKAKL